MLQQGRKYSGGSGYRYGFNGKEKSDEVYGDGNVYDYGFRIYNPRLGKFLSVDPLQSKYPELTSYQFSHNSPIDGVDLDGRERMDMRLIKNEDGTCKLETISTGPESKRYSNSFWTVTKIPAYIRLEYNGQHYIFADGRVHSKIPSREVFAAQINYMKDYYSFIANPNPDSYVSEEEANDNLMSELAARTIVGLAEETSNRVIGKMSNRIQWRGKYTSKSTDKQQASTNSGTNTKSQGALVKPIVIKNRTPQNGEGFGSQSYSLSNGSINLNGRSVTNGTFDFVVTNEGKLIIGTGHYNLSGEAESVQAAGQISIYKGKVTNINNSSGHYEPSIEQAKEFGNILQGAGVNIKGANLNIYNADGKKIDKIKL